MGYSAHIAFKHVCLAKSSPSMGDTSTRLTVNGQITQQTNDCPLHLAAAGVLASKSKDCGHRDTLEYQVSALACKGKQARQGTSTTCEQSGEHLLPM